MRLLLASLLLGYAAYWSLRFSYAYWLFRMNTPASVARAAALDESNSRYQAWLAERLENEGQDSSAALEAAARFDPFDSRVWIRRGLNAEVAGNISDAERFLLHAAAIDKLIEPRWTLMNFYFRRGEKEQFWRWAKESFAISYGDRRPLLELCWRMNADVSQMSHDPEVLKQLLVFLISKQRLDEAATLAEHRVIEDRTTLGDLVERLLDRGDGGRAVGVWNSMCRRGLLPYQPLDPDNGRSLTNANFAVFPTSVGFDWRVTQEPEITVIKAGSSDGVRVILSGKEPDSCKLLSQMMPVKPGQRYRLRFWYRTSGASGIAMSVANQVGPDLVSDEWREQSISFDSGQQSLATLSVEYRRPTGKMRMEGSLSLRAFSLDLEE